MNRESIHNLSYNCYYKHLKDWTPIEPAKAFLECINSFELIYNDTPICGEYVCPVPSEIYEDKRLSWEEFFSDETMQRMKTINDLRTWTSFTLAHTCLDYETIINKGLSYYVDMLKNLISKENNEEKIEYGKAMVFALKSCQRLSDRYKDLLLSQNCLNENLLKALETVPYKPAYDFLSAAQSLWIMHTLIPVSDKCFDSVSMGAVDRFLYPFYARDKDKYPKEYFIDIISFIMNQLQFYHDGSCNWSLGGLKDGEDGVNELTYIILEAEKRVMGASPIIALRVSQKTSDEFLFNFINKEFFSIGQPTFYSEENCRKALIERGVEKEDIEKMALSSCMTICIPGKDISDMWGIVVNSHVPLEMSLCNGETLNKKYISEYKAGSIETPEDILNSYEIYYKEFLSLAISDYYEKCRYASVFNQNPLLSALLDGSRETLTDRAKLNVKYHNVTVECMAFGNTANALAAIYKNCIILKKYTVEKLIEATKAEFKGYEDILKEVLSVPKFGENTKDIYTADWFAVRLTEIFSKVCKELSHDNINFVPSYHTLDSNVSWGAELPATLDGRLYGEPVNKNAGPTLATREASHTDIIQSVGSLPQTKMTGGQPLDLYFPQNMLLGKNKNKVLALIRTYLNMNGLQLQVNSANIDLLEKAHNNPELYPNIIVRIGGYSLRFGAMSPESREEHIKRVKKEILQYS